MKPSFAVLAALLVLAGCTAKQELSSQGTEDAPDTTVATNEAKTDPATQAQPDLAPTNEPPKTDGEPAKPTTNDAPATGVTMASLAGKYDGKIDVPQAAVDTALAKVPPANRAQAEAFMNQMLTSIKNAKIMIELAKDGTYVATTTTDGKTETEKGKWSLDVAKGTVDIKSPELSQERIAMMKQQGATPEVIAQAQNATETAKIEDGGRRLVMSNTQEGVTVTVTFTKR